MCSKNHNHMTDASWDMKCERHKFLSFWDIFCPFTPITSLKNTTWKNHKKTPGNIILLHMCTENEDHMMYGSWDIRCDRLSFFVILGHFLPFDPLINPNNQNFENINRSLEILSCVMCTRNENHMIYSSWDMERHRQNFLSF